MGNNEAGYAVGMAVVGMHRLGLLTLDTLDVICEPWRGCDVDSGGRDQELEQAYQAAICALLDSLGPDAAEGACGVTSVPPTTPPLPGWTMEDTIDDWRFDRVFGLMRRRYEFC